MLCIVVSHIIVDLEIHRVPLTNCPELEHLLLHDLLATGCRLLGLSLVTNLKSNVCTGLTTQNTRGHAFNRLSIKCNSISAPYFFN
jgi:hypothetical protein